MHVDTPITRVATPLPRKPRPLLALPKKRAASPHSQKLAQRPSTSVSVRARRSVPFERFYSHEDKNKALPEDVVKELHDVRNLFLCSHNLLSFCHIRHLESMTNLQSLNVHMNAISRIESIGHLHNLTKLDISANELRTIDENAFAGLRKLRYLNLSSNFITSISGFQQLPALEWLSLAFNELQDIRELRRLPCPTRLHYLDVCGNKIAKFRDLQTSIASCDELSELRVETPKTTSLLPTVPPQLQLRENLFCAAEPRYAEWLMMHFVKLKLLNGSPCGWDPVAQVGKGERETFVEMGSPTSGGDATAPRYQSTPHVQLHGTSFIPLQSHSDALQAAAAVGASFSSTVTTTTTITGSAGASFSSDRGDNAEDSHDAHEVLVANSRCTREVDSNNSVSRAVLTDISLPPHEMLHLTNAEEIASKNVLKDKNERLELQLQRTQEQLVLRVAMEADLRLNLEDIRDAHADFVEAFALEKKRLSEQVSALKDELSRRAEEAAVLQTKSRVGMEEHIKRLTAELEEQHRRQLNRSLRKVEEKLSSAQHEASEKIAELHNQLKDAVKRKEQLEAENNQAHLSIRQGQMELQAAKGEMRTCVGHMWWLEALHDIRLQELMARHQIETAAWWAFAACVTAYGQQWRRQSESIWMNQCKHQRAWEEYVESLQRHFKEELSHCWAVRAASPNRVDVACDAIELESREGATSQELEQLREALSLTRNSEQLISRENERLLCAVAEKETELRDLSQQLEDAQAALRKSQSESELERDNLLRTVRNLREAIEKKDSALTELEEEARIKIDEKRSIIAKLRVQLKEAEEAIEGHAQDAAKLSLVQEELRRTKSELSVLQKERAESSVPQQRQLTELLGELEETKRQLATTTLRERQQSVVLARAGEALSLMRGQLARVDQVNGSLTAQLSERDALLMSAEAEKERLRQQWREVQEAVRTHQQGALFALSKLMADDIGR
ncbi:putative Leucine Rich repeats (2 copies) putativeeat [Trypanosoma vivax]|nr:hypothetical protein TRVL_02105 [Trypanosoma vivax]KAH8619138.1 putative Leucine Rich repeats (2 copies) putativeeat [Trypanosoma vivax]